MKDYEKKVAYEVQLLMEVGTSIPDIIKTIHKKTGMCLSSVQVTKIGASVAKKFEEDPDHVMNLPMTYPNIAILLRNGIKSINVAMIMASNDSDRFEKLAGMTTLKAIKIFECLEFYIGAHSEFYMNREESTDIDLETEMEPMTPQVPVKEEEKVEVEEFFDIEDQILRLIGNMLESEWVPKEPINPENFDYSQDDILYSSGKHFVLIRREFLEDHFNQTILPHVPESIYNPFKYGVGQLANRGYFHNRITDNKKYAFCRWAEDTGNKCMYVKVYMDKLQDYLNRDIDLHPVFAIPEEFDTTSNIVAHDLHDHVMSEKLRTNVVLNFNKKIMPDQYICQFTQFVQIPGEDPYEFNTETRTGTYMYNNNFVSEGVLMVADGCENTEELKNDVVSLIMFASIGK